MADLLTACLAFPPERRKNNNFIAKDYDTRIKAFIKDLQRHDSSPGWTKPIDGKNILELLDPAVNSIPYALALQKQIMSPERDPKRLQTLFRLALDFLGQYDGIQIRYIAELWYSIMDYVSRGLTQTGSTDMTPLVVSLLRLDPTVGTFTTWHLSTVRACLQAGAPSQALPILDKNIYAYPQSSPKKDLDDYNCDDHELSNVYITAKSGFTGKIEPQYVLEYYLLGAHVYTGLRNFDRARLFLENVLLSPTASNTTSMLQVEAYKKWVLVGLLAEGKTFPLPKTLDQAFLKNVRSVSKPYDTLGDDCNKRDWKKFHADVDAGAAIWMDDGNLRLVQEAGEALQRYRIIDLQKTYAALPISRVSTLLELPPEAVLPLVDEMIRLKYLNASLSSANSDTILHFHPTATEAESTTQGDSLEVQTQRIVDLVTFVKDADRRLQLTREYVDYAKRVKRQGGGEDLADAMDLSYEPGFPDPVGDGEDDEDIMAV